MTTIKEAADELRALGHATLGTPCWKDLVEMADRWDPPPPIEVGYRFRNPYTGLVGTVVYVYPDGADCAIEWGHRERRTVWPMNEIRVCE